MSENPNKEAQVTTPRRLSEDWLAVLIAAVIIFLSVIGILGENGIHITF